MAHWCRIGLLRIGLFKLYQLHKWAMVSLCIHLIWRAFSVGTGTLFYQYPQGGLMWLFVRHILEAQEKSHHSSWATFSQPTVLKDTESQSHCFPYWDVRQSKMCTFSVLLSPFNLQNTNLDLADEPLILLGHLKAVANNSLQHPEA